MREAAAAIDPQGAWDLSISYDYGSKINAFAKCFAVCAAESIATCHRSLAGELRSSFDQYVDYYFELFADRHEQQQHVIFSRDLAFVILGISTMYQTCKSEDLLRRLQRLCDVLLGFEIRFNDAGGDPSGSSCVWIAHARPTSLHSAPLLALTRSQTHVPHACRQRSGAGAGFALRRARWMSASRVVERSRPDDRRQWGSAYRERVLEFQAGMTLRFLPLRKSRTPNALVAGRHNERMGLFETIAAPTQAINLSM